MERWSISEVAQLSNVTSRALRHYDAIGLLQPAGIGSNGHRYYERPHLLRLQEILVLRALGLPLEEIGAVLDEGRDQLSALRQHRDGLLAESGRLAVLARTVELTIDHLLKGQDMPAEQLFEGFDPQRQAEYETEIASRYGEDAVAESKRRTRGWTPEQFAATDAAYRDVEIKLTALLEAGIDAGDEQVLAVIAGHYAIVDQFWTPDRASYTGLGEMYVDDPRFLARYDARHPGLAAYLRDAIAAYASGRL